MNWHCERPTIYIYMCLTLGCRLMSTYIIPSIATTIVAIHFHLICQKYWAVAHRARPPHSHNLSSKYCPCNQTEFHFGPIVRVAAARTSLSYLDAICSFSATPDIHYTNGGLSCALSAVPLHPFTCISVCLLRVHTHTHTHSRIILGPAMRNSSIMPFPKPNRNPRK